MKYQAQSAVQRCHACDVTDLKVKISSDFSVLSLIVLTQMQASIEQDEAPDTVKNKRTSLTLPMLRLLSPKAQGCKDILKTI